MAWKPFWASNLQWNKWASSWRSGGRGGVTEMAKPQVVNDQSFEQDVLKSDTPVLVDFWATWCGPCRAIAPIVEELAKDYQGKITIGKMDVDANSATPMRYKVTGIPTLLVFKGGQVVEQLVGYRPKEAIAQALDKHIGGTRLDAASADKATV